MYICSDQPVRVESQNCTFNSQQKLQMRTSLELLTAVSKHFSKVNWTSIIYSPSEQ